MTYKEFWIKKGTNNFDYSWTEPEEISFDRGDQFYDAILEYHAKGGIHVIEKKAYDDVVKMLDEAIDVLEFVIENSGTSSDYNLRARKLLEKWRKERKP